MAIVITQGQDPARRAALNTSVTIFAVWGATLALAGGLGAGAVATVMSARFVFMSARADAAFFGRPVVQLYAADPALRDATAIYMTMLSAALGSLGIAVVTLSWFGLRRGSRGALLGLTLAPVPLVIWFVILRFRYVSRGAGIAFADVPPFVWLGALVGLLGGAVGWYGLGRAGGAA